MKDSFAPTSRAILVSAALVILIAGMKQAAPLLVPFLLAIFIAVISFPLMSWLQQKGLSKGVSLTLVMLLVVLIGIGLTLLIGNSLTDFSQTLPEYQRKITAEWGQAIAWLQDHGISVAEQLKGIADPAAAMGLISSILKGFGNVLTNSLLIILTVIFILMETAGVTKKVLVMHGKEADGQAVNEDFSQVFVEKLRDYMSMKTIISMITGCIVALAMWLIGLDFPILWGVLAFMLNFVPNIGSIIAAVPAVLLALVQLGFSSALLVTAVYVAINVLIGSVIEPKYMGKGLGLSTLVVFVSLVFWGWVLGPVGMLLSVPLTITVKLALDSEPETQWLGHLLGPADD